MFTLSCLLKPSGRVHFALVSHDMHAWINTWSYPWLTAPATICWHGTLNFALNFHRTHIFYLLSFLDSHQLIFKIPETFFNSLFFPNMFFFNFYFIFKLYNIVLVLPNIKMNPPKVYMCSPFWTLLPPPSPYHPSGLSQCTSPKHPVSCLEPGLATRFIYDIIRISMPFSHIIPPSPSPTESKRLFYTSVSLLLSHIQGYCYHLSKFHIYALVNCIGVFLSGLLHSV